MARDGEGGEGAKVSPPFFYLLLLGGDFNFQRSWVREVLSFWVGVFTGFLFVFLLGM